MKKLQIRFFLMLIFRYNDVTLAEQHWHFPWQTPLSVSLQGVMAQLAANHTFSEASQWNKQEILFKRQEQIVLT